MSSDLQTSEPFPLFIDYGNPSPEYFSRSNIVDMFKSSTLQLDRAQGLAAAKLLRSLRLRYYQYEVTLGLYVMTPGEKFVVNTIILGVLGALLYALCVGLQPFLVRTICQLIFYTEGSYAGVEDVCAGVSCS